MKLSEALIIRSDLQKRVEQIRARLVANAKVQEGDKTVENPEEMMAELNQTLLDLGNIIKKINITNSSIRDGNKTMTELLADRDMLSMKIKIGQEFLAAARNKIDRYSKNEIKIISSVNVKEEQNKLDMLSKELRELDIKIQALNWQCDLI
jgi:hypothetical protein